MDTLIKAVERFISGDWGAENYSPESSEEVVCIRGADIENVQGGIYDSIPNRYISSSSLANKKLKVGDIVIEKSGGSPTQSTGRTCYISEDLIKEKKDVVCSNFCAAFSIRETWDYKYIYYYIQNIYNQGNFFNFEGKTSGIRNLLLDTAFKSIPLPPIDKTIQTKLSGILERIDQKISLNTRMNAELEAMAKQLYDYWFVQFDFPDENGNPYKSSGGKMVWNEKLKREIPEGWKDGTIGNLFNTQAGYAFKSSEWKEYGHPVITIKNIHDDGSVSFTDTSYVEKYDCKLEKYSSNNGNMVFAMSGNTIGKVGIISSKVSNVLINQRVLIIKTNTNSIAFPYFVITDKKIQNMVFQLGANSAQPNISENEFKSIKICIPPKSILDYFNMLFKHSFEKIINNRIENTTLTNLRNSLLPMLMNGQVTIE